MLVNFVVNKGEDHALYKFTHDKYFKSVYFSSIIRSKGIPTNEEVAKKVEKNPKSELLKHAQGLIKNITDEDRK